MGIGNILSALIDKRGTNVNKLAQEASVPPQTLYSMIRRDSMKVDIEVLIRVCHVLGVPVEYIYNKYKGKDSPSYFLFSDHEVNLITKYRALDDAGRELVDSMIDKLYEQHSSKSTESWGEITAS